MYLSAAMEGENMRPALAYALAHETAHMSEAEVIALVRKARQNLGIKSDTAAKVEETPAPPTIQAPTARPRVRRRVEVTV